MRDLKYALLCARVGWRKLFTNPVPLTLLCLIFVFSLMNLGWVVDFCTATRTRVSPWVFPFTFDVPAMQIYYGAMLLLLFSGAPFADGHTPFLMIRTGKANWICGQVLYVWSMALALPLAIYASELIVLFPRLGVSSGWGGVIRSIAVDATLLGQYGIEPTGMFFYSAMLNAYSAVGATLRAMLLSVAVTAFFGTLILLLNVTVRPGFGVAVAGGLVFWSALSGIIGQFLYGQWIRYTAPLSWLSLFTMAPHAEFAPSIPTAIASLIGLSFIFSAGAVFGFCRRDAQNRT